MQCDLRSYYMCIFPCWWYSMLSTKLVWRPIGWILIYLSLRTLWWYQPSSVGVNSSCRTGPSRLFRRVTATTQTGRSAQLMTHSATTTCATTLFTLHSAKDTRLFVLVNDALGIPANVCLNDGGDDWRLQQCCYYNDIAVLMTLMNSGGAEIFLTAGA